jgi:hypothetical protein
MSAAGMVNLEHRHGRSGKDIVDHPSRENGDLANALAGLTLFVKNENSFLAEAL